MARQDGDEEPTIAIAVRTAIEAAFAAAPAMAGAIFGPEVGVGVAALAPAGAQIAETVSNILTSRALDVRAGAEDAGLDFGNLAETITSGDELAIELWRRVVRAGVDSPWQQKRRALGHALAEGTLGELGFDKELHLRIVQGIDAVEQWDVRVLNFIDRIEDDAVSGTRARIARIEDLRREFTDIVVDVVIENLESNGLVDNIGRGPGLRSVSMWTPTRIGDEVLRIIRAATVEDQGF